MFSRILVVVLAAIGIASSGPAAVWSKNSHQTVGTIADLLIQGSNAGTQVASILGTAGGRQLTLQSVVRAD